MIDTKELRRLAQAATPSPWVSHGRYIGTPRHMSYIGEVRDQCGNWSDTEKSRADAAFIAAANPAAISELLDRLEAAEKVRDWNAERLEEAIEELKALRAKIEAAEKRKPVMWANSSNIISTRIWPARGSVGYQHTCSETKTAYHDTPLYLAPGAKGEDK